MKISSALVVLFALTLAGCESFSDVKDQFKAKLAARDRPHVRAFAADSRATYEAARAALEGIEFRFVRGGPAQGELEAISGLGAGDSLRSARQITMTVRFLAGPPPEGGTEVQVWLHEIIEANVGSSTGRATTAPLRDSALYEAFFRNLQQALTPAKKG